MKKAILTILLIFSSVISYADSALQTFLDNRAVNANSTAVLIQDLATGEITVEHNADKALLPASVMKTVTIAALVEEEGIDKRYHTKVYCDGPVRDGVLHGDLVIVAGGDPTLGATCEPSSSDIMQEIPEALLKKGISRIAGDLRADTSLYMGPSCPATWPAEDRREGYGTGCHSLNYRHNASGSRSVGDPAPVFLSRLTAALSQAGIRLDGKALASDKGVSSRKARLLLDHTSDRYEEVMRSCMMRSDNLFAENFLRTFGVARGKDGSPDSCAVEMQKFWQDRKIPCRGVSIIDGSGLSRSNRVTADFIGAILRRMGENMEYAAFMPLAGQEGTLSKFLKGSALDSYVAMKTGSMRGIQCYAGYKLDEQFAPTHVIVILMNDIGSRAEARGAAERLLLQTFASSASEEEGTER